MTPAVLPVALGEALSEVDPAEMRGSVKGMDCALRAVCAAGAEAWCGPLAGLVQALEAVARVDLALARLVEGHADALRILGQAGKTPREGVYGVWASRSVGTGVAGACHGGHYRLEGELRFASGVGLVDRALLPVALGGGQQRLLDVTVEPTGFRPDPGSWRTPAMDASRTLTVTVSAEAPAEAAVGPLDFYLDRPGFVVGGLGPAAVWVGGAQHVLDQLVAAAAVFPPTEAQLRRIGLVDQHVWTARTALVTTATGLEQDTGDDVPVRVSRVRAAAALAGEVAVTEAPHVVGPGGLSRDERLARVLHDLTVYIRQLALDPELIGRGRLLTAPGGGV